ncbi:hypothetical protein HETIRDRAFT_424611 [Heterobasidion irregulare TC 32-1]|uniref:Uncharacterized protein n=1 Tax=Heterobasidion irregulare (strain TC 32-1) TaxID=747525 RepID=W4KH99_HETIT|nr:uncharacterized protein HETIRDRAFT_424611 [Heterobasidion irregulare TC 32-1]ETW85233.1 hypothetical protein HETIRDRAFT_424611 [Heterobasidion irregulare TC 32-1]
MTRLMRSYPHLAQVHHAPNPMSTRHTVRAITQTSRTKTFTFLGSGGLLYSHGLTPTSPMVNTIGLMRHSHIPRSLKLILSFSLLRAMRTCPGHPMGQQQPDGMPVAFPVPLPATPTYMEAATCHIPTSTFSTLVYPIEVEEHPLMHGAVPFSSLLGTIYLIQGPWRGMVWEIVEVSRDIVLRGLSKVPLRMPVKEVPKPIPELPQAGAVGALRRYGGGAEAEESEGRKGKQGGEGGRKPGRERRKGGEVHTVHAPNHEVWAVFGLAAEPLCGERKRDGGSAKPDPCGPSTGAWQRPQRYYIDIDDVHPQGGDPHKL